MSPAKLQYNRKEIASLAERLNARGSSRLLIKEWPNMAIDLKTSASLLRKWLANDPFDAVEIELTNGL